MVDGKAYLSYLADIFQKLNMLNHQLQEAYKTLVDAKAKIFGFITLTEISQKCIQDRNFEKFEWLLKCEVTDPVIRVIVNHLKTLSSDLKERFSDLKRLDFPTWMVQPMLADLSETTTIKYQDELTEIQNDESMKALFNIKGLMAWACDET